MAISKLILNGETQMDVTSNTNTSNNMLSGVVGTKNDGTTVTGNIATKTSSDLTASGATVTAPAGYYANAASKAVSTTTHPNPTASIASSTGVVTASHTQGTGYVTGGTTTGTFNLTTQAGKTVTPTETAQTAVASYRWTTGPINVAAISSTYVGTGVTTRSAADLTANGSVVTAPAGYYSTATTKTVAAGSAFPPAVTITKAPTIGVNTSGVVTASYNGSSSITPTITSGYISQGTAGTISTTGTSTYQLTSQAAATYYPSTADQTIASQRWLVGNQTIKSVTTSNLTAENIAEGVVVQVGDSANASRITQITGTYSSGSKHTAVITSTTAYRSYIYYNDVQYYVNQPFEFSAGDVCVIQVYGEMGQADIRENGTKIGESNVGDTYKYFYVLPDCDIEISTSPNGYSAYVDIVFAGNIQSVKNVSINQNGTFTLLPDNTINITKDSTYTASSPSGFKYSVPELSQLVVGETYKLAISFRDSGRQLTGAYYNDNFIFNGYYEDTGTNTIQFSINNKSINMRFYEALTVDGISGYGIYVSGNSNDSNIGSLHIKISKATAMATVSASVDVSGGGGGFTVDQIAMRTISGDISGSATTIDMYAFYSCHNLTTANFPLCTSIGNSAFANCSSLTTASFPSCISIEGSAFHSCIRLTTVSFPLCTLIGNSAFTHCYSLTTANFPLCLSIGGYAFANCSSLTTASFPSCTYIGSYAFRSCTRLTTASFPSCSSISMCAFHSCISLTTANFPLCTSIGGSAFYFCSRLTTVSFPLCTSIGTNVFAYCYSLTTVSFPSCTLIGTSVFVYCYNLLSIYLLGSSVPFLSSNAFYSTPIGGRTTSTGGVYGSIFVPASLYNSYLTATNWSLYSDRIVSV